MCLPVHAGGLQLTDRITDDARTVRNSRTPVPDHLDHGTVLVEQRK
jgi:hypothetical protein